MAWQDRVVQIRAEARALGFSTYRLCQRAGAPYSTVQRWMTGATGPRLSNYEPVCEQLEAELAKVREEVLARPMRRAS